MNLCIIKSFFIKLIFHEKNYLNQNFIWYKDIKNVYIIYVTGYGVPDILDIENYNNKKVSKCIDDNSVVMINSSYPNYLKGNNIIKGAFGVHDIYNDLIVNDESQKIIIQCLNEIFKVTPNDAIDEDINYYDIANDLNNYNY